MTTAELRGLDLLHRAEVLAEAHDHHDASMGSRGERWVGEQDRISMVSGSGDVRAVARVVGDDRREESAAGIAYLRNVAPEVGLVLRGLGDEVRRLSRALPNWTHAEALRQRDALIQVSVDQAAQIASLQAQVGQLTAQIDRLMQERSTSHGNR